MTMETNIEVLRGYEEAGCPLARELRVLRAMCSCGADDASVDEAEARYLELRALAAMAAQPEAQAGGEVDDEPLTPERAEYFAGAVAAAWCKSDMQVRARRCKDAAAVIRSMIPLLTTPPPSAVPAGWKLVPVEPTEAMQFPSYMGPDGPKWPMRKSIYRAMLAAAPQPPANAWQPIETAPRDGTTPILLHGHGGTLIGIRPIDCPNDAACDMLGLACYPTHWMPLPQPPAKEG